LEVYNADEQLKILERWWRENWLALAVGLLLGLAVVGGWIGWQMYSRQQSEQASVAYDKLLLSLQGDSVTGAMEIGKRLTSQYRRTPYAALGALALAGELARRSDPDSAIQQLQWVEAYAKDRKLRRVATLRKARLLWDKNQTDAALQSLNLTKKKDTFYPLFAELRGDILASLGKRSEAKAAYEQALSVDVDNALRTSVQQKLGDLSDVAVAAES
jgi:predicted negative regulator of RcsB-dependent stress response